MPILIAFDETRTGVRGLVEPGVSVVPDIFRHPDPYASTQLARHGVSIPVVDLSLPAPLAAAAAAGAGRDWGFFYLVNHHALVPSGFTDRLLAAVRAFNELPPTVRAAHYGRSVDGGVDYFSNFDLYRSGAASWRDTIEVTFGPSRPDTERIPAVCRSEIVGWDAHATTVARAVMALLCEGLGLAADALEEASCLEGKVMVCHYYPMCPEPERTMGIVPHTDPVVLTILAQDDVGGLQVKHTNKNGESYWVDAKPVPGALMINVGDLLQSPNSLLAGNDFFSADAVLGLHTVHVSPTPKDSIATNPAATMASSAAATDRAALVKAFDETRTGVRGLVESGVSVVPDIFRHPDPYASTPLAPPGVSIPVVDLSLPAPLAAEAAAGAARDWGFFYLVNYHALVPSGFTDRLLAAVRAFNELPAAERAAHYGRSVDGGVNYFSNVDLYRSGAASWRDTIQVMFGPSRADEERIPAACRAEIVGWDAHATAVARAVMALLCEGLGLRGETLEEASCLEGKVTVCHYYPVCPEPERTMGIVPHTDPGVLTILAQDGVGGLQVKHTNEDGESYWVDAKPVPGALVINVGDLLQMMSNDNYKSVEHRVVMNSHEEARVSSAIFYNPGKRGILLCLSFWGPSLNETLRAKLSSSTSKYKAFDETRTGVRGLVEPGVSVVPDIFRHPDPYASTQLARHGVSIPVVDLSLPAPLAAAAAAGAGRDWGFFYLVNHHALVPSGFTDRLLAAVRAFNELPPTVRAAHYGRSVDGGVDYFSNFDLYRSGAASWRDTIEVTFGPSRPDTERIPAVCRSEIVGWDAHATTVARAVMALLCEGLGLAADALEEASCLEGKVMVCHYYPMCPEPERTMGIVPHTDPVVLTILAQDDVGGLQVKHTNKNGESYWVDAKPVPGALMINVGDLLQVKFIQLVPKLPNSVRRPYG
uniref:Fe2OG dioxygenase domain-containing protein n=1 Tax=Oryza punctata TaxID=4537 RepID=A0A0E0LA29_ORYPU